LLGIAERISGIDLDKKAAWQLFFKVAVIIHKRRG